MNTENLKNLFTDEDFEMLNKAVEALPKLGLTSALMTEMLFAGLSKNDEYSEDRAKKSAERLEKQKAEDAKLEKKCLELRFKLLQLKKALTNEQ